MQNPLRRKWLKLQSQAAVSDNRASFMTSCRFFGGRNDSPFCAERLEFEKYLFHLLSATPTWTWLSGGACLCESLKKKKKIWLGDCCQTLIDEWLHAKWRVRFYFYILSDEVNQTRRGSQCAAEAKAPLPEVKVSQCVSTCRADTMSPLLFLPGWETECTL